MADDSAQLRDSHTAWLSKSRHRQHHCGRGLAAALLDLSAADVVGLGTGANTTIMGRKTEVVEASVMRMRAGHEADRLSPEQVLAAVGGPESCVLVVVVTHGNLIVEAAGVPLPKDGRVTRLMSVGGQAR